MTTPDELEAQLAALRARRAALAEAAQARLTPTLDELVALESKALEDDELLERFQLEHGARAVVISRTEAGAVILRRPHIAAYRKFQDRGALTSDSAEELVKSCLLHPSKPELDKILRQIPGVLVTLASACVELAGHRTAELGAK